MKKITLLALVLLLVGLVAGVKAADYFTVGSIDDFNFYNEEVYKTGQAIVENFNNDKINTPGLTITEVGGAGTFKLGYYENIVDKDVNLPAGRYQVYNYAGGMNGFGGWFDLAGPGGPGSSIDVYVGATFVGNIPNTYAGQFWGFFSNIGPFTSVTFVEGPGSAQETYQVVDLAICPAVPVPASLLLLGSGVLGLVGIGIRRKL